MPMSRVFRNRRVAGSLGAASLVSALMLVSAPAGAADQVFTSDGTFTVPVGVAEITVTAIGGSGGSCAQSTGGRGGTVVAVLTVTPGETLAVHVGGAGLDCDSTQSVLAGGANGGGVAGNAPHSGSGGGASDVRSSGDTLADRLIVAGGGGGSALDGSTTRDGGHGGNPDGGAGSGQCNGGGEGGTQTAGGAVFPYGNSMPGELGVGGEGTFGGGGGGYYGGGGGDYYGSGGGGSSWVGARLIGAPTYGIAASAGAGSVTIDWTPPPPPTTTTTTTTVPTTTVPTSAPEAGYGVDHTATMTTTVEGTVQLTGTNWKPGTPVDVTVHSEPVHLGTLVADAGGAVDGTFTLPAAVPAGDHLVVLSGTAVDGRPAVVSLVLGVTEAAPAQIAFTC